MMLRGFIPDVSWLVQIAKLARARTNIFYFKVVLYLSYFYKNKELPIRLAFFWTSLILTNIVASFLAYGILHLRGRNGFAGWQWLFALEGGLTASIGIISW